MKEIRPLTSLRAFAALLVFLYHYAYLFPPATRGGAPGVEWIPLMPIWRQGQVGVSIFFVLSGFLITRIYFDSMARGAVPLRLFIVKRIARIWPLFLVFALIQHLALAVRGDWPGLSALVTLTMTQGWFEHLRYAGLPTAWSLTIEESFYLFAPLLFLILRRTTHEAAAGREPLSWPRLRRLVLVLSGVVVSLAVAGLAVVRLSTGLGIDWQGFLGSNAHMAHATLFGRFPEFAIGVIAAFVHRGVDLTERLRGRRADLAAAASVAVITASIWGKDRLAGGDSGGPVLVYALTYLVAAGSGAAILALSTPHGILQRALSHPLPVFLGKISYGFYLVQLTVMMTPLLALSDGLGWARLPVLLVLTNAFCAVVYLVVEAPARHAIVRRWGT